MAEIWMILSLSLIAALAWFPCCCGTGGGGGNDCACCTTTTPDTVTVTIGNLVNKGCTNCSSAFAGAYSVPKITECEWYLDQDITCSTTSDSQIVIQFYIECTDTTYGYLYVNTCFDPCQASDSSVYYYTLTIADTTMECNDTYVDAAFLEASTSTGVDAPCGNGTAFLTVQLN